MNKYTAIFGSSAKRIWLGHNTLASNRECAVNWVHYILESSCMHIEKYVQLYEWVESSDGKSFHLELIWEDAV